MPRKTLACHGSFPPHSTQCLMPRHRSPQKTYDAEAPRPAVLNATSTRGARCWTQLAGSTARCVLGTERTDASRSRLWCGPSRRPRTAAIMNVIFAVPIAAAPLERHAPNCRISSHRLAYAILGALCQFFPYRPWQDFAGECGAHAPRTNLIQHHPGVGCRFAATPACNFSDNLIPRGAPVNSAQGARTGIRQMRMTGVQAARPYRFAKLGRGQRRPGQGFGQQGMQCVLRRKPWPYLGGTSRVRRMCECACACGRARVRVRVCVCVCACVRKRVSSCRTRMRTIRGVTQQG